jgi:hypothetical protein
MTEHELLRAVLDLCAESGLHVFHAYDSRKTVGKGFPDLVVASPRKVIYVELKSPTGRLTTDQRIWYYQLTAAGVTYHLWRPVDLVTGKIETCLLNL